MVKSDRRLAVYDAIGTLLALLALGVGLWTGLVRYPKSDHILRAAQRRLDKARTDARSIDVTVRTQQTRLEELEQKLALEGPLPDRMPVDATLRELSEFASRNGVKVTNVRPSDVRTFGSVTEQRFSISATCGFEQLLGFLETFENADIWADITDIGVATGGRSNRTAKVEPSVSLVVSLFSANRDTESSR